MKRIRVNISIPFSTIKSYNKFNDKCNEIKFQFHLVRLKGRPIRKDKAVFHLFQFHLVRLKDILVSTQFDSAIFQFHLVRLKAFQRP